MIEKIEPWVRGKKILLLGFGREGKSTWEVLRRLGTFQSVDIADQSASGELPEGIGKWISGPDYQSCLNDYDVVFKSPGVVLEKPVQDYSCQILSQTEVFFRSSRLLFLIGKVLPRSDYRYHGHQGKEYDYHAAVSFAQTCRIRYGSGRKYRNSRVRSYGRDRTGNKDCV